jgi:hypothetical protein
MKIGELNGKSLVGLRLQDDDIIFKIEGTQAELSYWQTFTFAVGDYLYVWDEQAISDFRKTAPQTKRQGVSLLDRTSIR